MIDISYDKDLVGPWVFRQINKAWGPEGREVVGLVDGDRVLAGAVFEDYSGPGGTVQAHMAIGNPHAPIKKWLFASSAYAFNQLGVTRIIGLVPSYNVEALRFDLRIGFKAEAVIENVFPDGDLVILGLSREDCWFLPKQKQAA